MCQQPTKLRESGTPLSWRVSRKKSFSLPKESYSCLWLKPVVTSNQPLLQIMDELCQGVLEESCSSVHLVLLWCVLSKKPFEFSSHCSPPFLSFLFSSPSPLGVFSLLPWLGRGTEITGIVIAFTVIPAPPKIVFWFSYFESCDAVTLPQSHFRQRLPFPFCFTNAQCPTSHQPVMQKKKKKMWLIGQFEIFHATITSWSVSLARLP